MVKSVRQIFYEKGMTNVYKNLTPTERKIVAELADGHSVILTDNIKDEFSRLLIFQFSEDREAISDATITLLEKLGNSFSLNFKSRQINVNKGDNGVTLR